MSLDLSDSGTVDDLAFLRDAPLATTEFQVRISGPVDLSPLANCPALKMVYVFNGSASEGLEISAALSELKYLYIHPPSGGEDLSFLAGCVSLTNVALIGCTELSDLSALVSAPRLGYVSLYDTRSLRDLSVLTELSDLVWLTIESAPLAGGLAAVVPVLDQLKCLSVWSVPTVKSLEALAGNALVYHNLDDCPITDLEPLGTLQSLKELRLRQLRDLNFAPLASLPQLRELTLTDINEPVDLSLFAQTDHRLRVELRNTPTVGETGPLVKIRRR